MLIIDLIALEFSMHGIIQYYYCTVDEFKVGAYVGHDVWCYRVKIYTHGGVGVKNFFGSFHSNGIFI